MQSVRKCALPFPKTENPCFRKGFRYKKPFSIHCIVKEGIILPDFRSDIAIDIDVIQSIWRYIAFAAMLHLFQLYISTKVSRLILQLL